MNERPIFKLVKTPSLEDALKSVEALKRLYGEDSVVYKESYRAYLELEKGRSVKREICGTTPEIMEYLYQEYLKTMKEKQNDC